MPGRSRSHGKILTRLIILTLGAVVALGAATAASAGTVRLRMTISPGSLTLAPTSFQLPPLRVTLNGTNQALAYHLPLTMTDSTGSGNGWHLTISSTMLRTGGSKPLSLPGGALSVTGASVVCAPGGSCIAPVNSVCYPLVVPAGLLSPPPVTVLNAAADSGLGRFVVTLGLSVNVPAYARKGAYSSTLLFAVASGP